MSWAQADNGDPYSQWKLDDEKNIMSDQFKHKIIDKSKQGGSGFISWQRLEKRFRQCGELRNDEKIRSVKVNERGITFSTIKE